MARKRMISPEFWTDEKLGLMPVEARLLFMGLISNADDEGRLPGNTLLIKSMVFPYDNYSANKIDEWLKILCQQNMVIRYQVNNQTYIQIVNFLKHQTINKATTSKIPAFENTIELLPDNYGSGVVDIPDDSLLKEKKEREKKLKEIKECWMKKFTEFWSLYPKKVAKPDAEKAWNKINPDEDLFNQIINGLERAKSSDKWIKNKGEYIPHPATWLNGKRWEDEYTDRDEGRFKHPWEKDI